MILPKLVNKVLFFCSRKCLDHKLININFIKKFLCIFAKKKVKHRIYFRIRCFYGLILNQIIRNERNVTFQRRVQTKTNLTNHLYNFVLYNKFAQYQKSTNLKILFMIEKIYIHIKYAKVMLNQTNIKRDTFYQHNIEVH